MLENQLQMEEALGGPVQPDIMSKFREGTYAEAGELIQNTWKMVMLEFLPRICKDGWGKRQSKKLISEEPEITEAMEALVCWYVDMYGTLRWIPEHDEDKKRAQEDKPKEKRGRRVSVAEKQQAKEGPKKFAYYWSLVRERRPASKDWEEALKEEAAKGDVLEQGEGGPTVGLATVAVQGRKRGRIAHMVDPVIPTMYKFGDDGKIENLAEV